METDSSILLMNVQERTLMLRSMNVDVVATSLMTMEMDWPISKIYVLIRLKELILMRAVVQTNKWMRILMAFVTQTPKVMVHRIVLEETNVLAVHQG